MKSYFYESNLHGFTGLDLSVADEPIFLLKTTAEGYFLPQTCADGHIEFHLYDILK